MAYTFSPPTQSVSATATLIGHNRLEPRPRTSEFNRSLRAEVRDATWLLARQWLSKEFRAEDRGTPAFAAIQMQSAVTNQLKLGANPVRAYDPLAPLEAQVQAQPLPVDAGLRLQMGHAWLRLLRANGLSQFVGAFRTRYPLTARQEDPTAAYDLRYAAARTTREVQEVLTILGGQALDGYALFLDLVANANAAGELVGGSQATRTNELAGSFVASYRRLYFPATADNAWSVATLGYEFALAAPGPDNTPTVLAAATHTGGSLHWHSVDQPSPAQFPDFPPASAPVLPTQRFIPTEIQFLGAPNARWWEFEDRRVDFGRVTGDSSDFGRMLLQEFIFLYQNDWFSLPYSVPVGSVNAVRSLEVTDVFGQRYRVHAAGASTQREPDAPDQAGPYLDQDWGRWSVYAQSQPGQRTASTPQVFVPATAVSPLVGKLVEQVLFLREEATNLVWAIEQTIPDGFGAGMDGAGAAAQVAEYLRTKATAAAPAASGTYRYQLATAVAENWIPFVARPDRQGVYYLEQGQMLRQVEGLALAEADRTVKPRTSLLQLGPFDAPYLIQEHQVPPTGLRVEGGFRRARGADGRIHLWFERHRSPGQRGGSSGLRYDALRPPSGT